MYSKYIKRPMDFTLALCAIIVLSPFLLIFTVIGGIAMKGNPFFTQLRPGKDEKIFKLIKFRTMTCEKDQNGEFLPDEQRLTKYGKFLRATSIDELPELFNIIKGDMSVIGPRPLLIEYLPRYNYEQRRRHEVRPGLTGLAQVNGRNLLTWEEKFNNDIWYIDNVSFILDTKIIFKTVGCVFERRGISSDNSETMEVFMGNKEEVNV